MMKIFISHSDKDSKLAEALSSELSRPGVNVWLAEKEVLPGDNWSLEVGKALQRADAMVVLLSPAAVESENVRREIAYALSSPKFEGRVVPVVVKPTEDIPWFLRELPMVHSRGAHGRSVKKLAEKIAETLQGWNEGMADHIAGQSKA